MAISFRCPGCKEEFQVDEAYGGRKWRCTNCSTTFVIPESSQAPASKPGPGTYRVAKSGPPGPARRADESLTPGWESYRSALRALNTGVLIALAAFLVFVGGYLLVPHFIKDISPGMVDTLNALPTLAQLLAFVAIVVLFVSVGQSIAVPSKSGARGWAILSICLAALGVATLIGAYFSFLIQSKIGFVLGNAPTLLAGVITGAIRFPDNDFMLTRFLTWSGLGLVVLANLLYAISLSRTAAFFRSGGLSFFSILYVILFALFIGGTVFLIASWDFLGLVLFPGGRPHLGGVNALPKERLPFFYGWVGAAVVLTIWFMILAALTRSRVPQREEAGE